MLTLQLIKGWDLFRVYSRCSYIVYGRCLPHVVCGPSVIGSIFDGYYHSVRVICDCIWVQSTMIPFSIVHLESRLDNYSIQKKRGEKWRFDDGERVICVYRVPCLPDVFSMKAYISWRKHSEYYKSRCLSPKMGVRLPKFCR